MLYIIYYILHIIYQYNMGPQSAVDREFVYIFLFVFLVSCWFFLLSSCFFRVVSSFSHPGSVPPSVTARAFTSLLPLLTTALVTHDVLLALRAKDEPEPHEQEPARVPSCSCSFLVRTLSHLGAILDHLGSILTHLGSILDHHGSILAPSWPHVGPSCLPKATPD